MPVSARAAVQAMSISPPAASLSQLNQPQHLLDAYARQLYRVAEHAEMVASRAAWVKVGRLKHRADSPSSSGKVCVWLAEDKRPAARRRREAEQHPQRRRLPAPFGPRKPVIVPGSSAKERSSTATRVPNRFVNDSATSAGAICPA